MSDLNITTSATITTLVTSPDKSALTGEEIAEVFFRVLIYVVGVVGNLLVIFVILFLNEFRKITHWYVLQLALADLLFLQTLPFRISEIVNYGWIHSETLCSTRQSILYFNYYASIMFLTIMALDRYMAVCHALSTQIQRIRSRTYSFIITGITWLVALVMCVPVMLYSALVGIEPHCSCTLDFPKDKEKWCQKNYGSEGPEGINSCMDEMFDLINKRGSCSSPFLPPSGSGNDSEEFGSWSNYNWFEDSGGLFSGMDFSDSGDDGDREKRAIHLGCFYKTDNGYAWHAFIYFNFFVMFVIPLIIITTSYILIVIRLMATNVGDRRISNAESTYSADGIAKKFWKTSRRRSSAASTGRSYREKMRVTVMCAVLVLLFLVCWLPFHSVHLAKIVGINSDDPNFCSRLGKVTSILAYLNSALNPYLYNFLGTFHKRMKQVKNHKKMQSFLSATGLSRLSGRPGSVANSSDASKGKRTSVPNESRAASITCEKIPLKTITMDKSADEHE